METHFRKIASIVLLLVFMGSFVMHQCIRLYFKASRRFVVEQLCERRNEPRNTCKGQCHLKKWSQKAKDTTAKMQENLKSDFICEFPFVFVFSKESVWSSVPYFEALIPVLLLGFENCIEDPPDAEGYT